MEAWVRVGALSIGGVLGVNARYWLGAWVEHRLGTHFPWATFTINASGSFAIGFLAVVLSRWMPHPYARLLIVTGFLGGYTTFSTFSLESVNLWERGAMRPALAYMAGSVTAGVSAAALGIALAYALTVPAAERSGGGAADAPASAPDGAGPGGGSP